MHIHKADKNPVEEHYQVVLAALTLSRPQREPHLLVNVCVFVFGSKHLRVFSLLDLYKCDILVLLSHIRFLHVRLIFPN